MNSFIPAYCRSIIRNHIKGNKLSSLLRHQTTCFLSSTSSLLNDNKDFRPSEELAKERYESRADEDIDRKRARLLYQSRKRGMLENGVILSSFADKYLNKLDPNELDQYDRLINLPTNDWDIFYWATKTKPTPLEFETPVMEKLRQHLHSKVSSESDNQISGGHSILDNRRPDEVVAPIKKNFYPLNVDIHEIDPTNYEQELFDERVKKFNNRESIKYMTEWRKQRFVQRIRRSLSSPISVRNMLDERKKEVQVYSQVLDPGNKTIAKEKIQPKNLIDTNYEKSMKHHNLLQYLMSSELTDDAQDYDDEAKAWADMMWHRSYGSADARIAPIDVRCKTCRSKLQCCDQGLDGYLTKELLHNLYDPTRSKEIRCQRCQFKSVYGANIGLDVSDSEFKRVVGDLNTKPSSIICILVDLTNLPCGIYDGLIDLIGKHHKIIIVGNKIDLLPFDGNLMIERVLNSLRNNVSKLRYNDSNLFASDFVAISARTGFGVEGLVTRILNLSKVPKEVYLIGTAHSGKSTLFNALLQSDLCAIRDSDLVSRVSKAELSDSVSMLKFPVHTPEGWEIELKKRKCEIVERNTVKREKSLLNLTTFRQATTPHLAFLINRDVFLPGPDSTQITPTDEGSLTVNQIDDAPLFTEDHPLKNLKQLTPLGATPDKFNHNPFCYQLPSTSTKDQILDLLTTEEKLEVFPHETIKPRKFSIRPLQTIFIAGLARLDLVTSSSNVLITVFASRYLPIHVIETKKADEFYHTFIGSSYLGVPFGGEERMKDWPKGLKSTENAEYLIRGSEYQDGQGDIVFSSIGWALVNVHKDQECIVKAFTPEARGIYLRQPPLLTFGRKIGSGRKVRDSPLFVNPSYRIDSIR